MNQNPSRLVIALLIVTAIPMIAVNVGLFALACWIFLRLVVSDTTAILIAVPLATALYSAFMVGILIWARGRRRRAAEEVHITIEPSS